MKKLMLAIAATTAFVSVASAEDWFNGGLGDGSLSGGSWTDPLPEGVTKPSSSYVLENVADPLSFTATTQKSLSSSTNLNFATSAKFAYSYDELPEIDSGAKAGIVVYTNEYYVLAKDDTTNNWAATGIAATSLDSEVAVNVTISNGNNAVYAIYNIAGTSITKEVVAAGDSAWGTVDYKGSGEVASLVGTTTSLGGSDYPIPGDKTIAKDVAEAWAVANGIALADLGAVLLSGTEFNGRTAAESCLLGVATNADLRATIIDDNDGMLTLELNCKPVAGGRVVFYAKKNGADYDSGDFAQREGSTDYAVVALPIGAGVYQIGVKVDNGEWIPVSQEVGVAETAVVPNQVCYLAAPWAECPVTNLFKKACCAEDDKLEVYDSNGDRWYTWSMTGGKWAYVADSGIIGDAEPELIIKKGQAVKYTTAATTSEQAKLYQVGDVSEIVETAIVPGGDSGAKWNLVASPRAPIQVAALPLDSTKARALVLGGEDGITAQKIYLKVGGVLYVKSGWDANAVKVTDTPVMEGAFFIKTKDAVKIEWPAAAAK